MRRILQVIGVFAALAAGLAWANRGVGPLVDGVVGPVLLAGLGLGALLAWRLRPPAPVEPTDPDPLRALSAWWRSTTLGAAAALCLASVALLREGTLFLNAQVGSAAPETVTTGVSRLSIRGRTCTVSLQPWRAGGLPVLVRLRDSDAALDASGEVVTCRTDDGAVIERGQRVAVHTRMGGLGLEYLVTDEQQRMLVPPCSTCGTH